MATTDKERIMVLGAPIQNTYSRKNNISFCSTQLLSPHSKTNLQYYKFIKGTSRFLL